MKTREIIFNPARYEADRQRHVARGLVAKAIQKGTLVRPDRCPRCGEPEQRFRNGRTNIEGHHHDYSKPLEVEWVCRTCHNAEQKEYDKSNPIPEPADSPQLIALRDALLSDDWERRPARIYPSRPSLDEYDDVPLFYSADYDARLHTGDKLRRLLGEWNPRQREPHPYKGHAAFFLGKHADGNAKQRSDKPPQVFRGKRGERKDEFDA